MLSMAASRRIWSLLMVQSATTPWDVAAASVVGDSTLSSWYVDGSLLRLGGIPDIPLCLLVCGS